MGIQALCPEWKLRAIKVLKPGKGQINIGAIYTDKNSRAYPGLSAV